MTHRFCPRPDRGDALLQAPSDRGRTGRGSACHWPRCRFPERPALPLAHLLRVPVVISTALAWCVSVLFAYFTNRKWVFHSTADGRRAVLKEMAAFFSCRLGTGVLDLGIMYVFADQLQFHDVAVKAVSNILVIVLNYVFSKVLIFRH